MDTCLLALQLATENMRIIKQHINRKVVENICYNKTKTKTNIYL